MKHSSEAPVLIHVCACGQKWKSVVEPEHVKRLGMVCDTCAIYESIPLAVHIP